ncbi:TRAP transporter large permease [Microvirga pudoricolor]|uniref:TRAP transporter large permease n=1 Tax=Microvirga pudoricolor TaxID=2778729 RepID=UPI00194ECD53|nr:TRAP transporter large permease [Microvirga pudoricolor]MBM6595319.1 TRAP transporter large permease [Microvirga pudoricolor]
MTEVTVILIVSLVFLVLMIAGLWIPVAITVAALVYILLESGWTGLNALGLVSWGSMYNFTLTSIPLFILMAELLLVTGLSDRIYRGLSRLVVRLPGGLLQTNIAGCAIFAAISGSSVATAAAIGSVALPQLKARNYDSAISSGTLAAGGTLGILIPPSIAMIVYGTFTETSISKLFMAGVLPGLLLVLLFMLYVGVRASLQPSIAPRDAMADEPFQWRETANDLLPFVALISLVMGSLYSGLATPTEAAAFGACLAAIICLIWGNLSFATLRTALAKTVRLSGSILFIVYAAYLLSYAIGMAGLADELVELVRSWQLSYLGLLLVVIVLYTILGCIMDSIGMMVITVPILHPVLLSYGVDPLWFGVALVVLIEIGQITPPLGLNLFVVQGISGTPLGNVIRGCVPFYLLLYLLLGLLVAFPAIVLWLPGGM